MPGALPSAHKKHYARARVETWVRFHHYIEAAPELGSQAAWANASFSVSAFSALVSLVISFSRPAELEHAFGQEAG